MPTEYAVSCALTDTIKKPKSVRFFYVAYSTERLRGPVKILKLDDILMDDDRYKSVLVDFDHLGEEGKMPFLSDTWIQNGRKEINSAGYEEASWEVYSENPTVMAEADKVTGGSIYGCPQDHEKDWYKNSKGEVIVTNFDFRSFGLLRSMTAGSGGSRLRDKKLQFSMENMENNSKKVAKFMYSDFGDYVIIKATGEVAKLISKTISSTDSGNVCIYQVELINGPQSTLVCSCDSGGWVDPAVCPLDDLDASDVLNYILGQQSSNQPVFINDSDLIVVANKMNEQYKEILGQKGMRFSLENVKTEDSKPTEVGKQTVEVEKTDIEINNQSQTSLNTATTDGSDEEPEFESSTKQLANALKTLTSKTKAIKFSKPNAVDTNIAEVKEVPNKSKPDPFLNLFTFI